MPSGACSLLIMTLARFFLPAYEQEERFRDAFDNFGRGFPMSRTYRGDNAMALHPSDKKHLPHEAWEPSADFGSTISTHKNEVQRALGGSHIHVVVVETLVGLLNGLSNQFIDDSGRETLVSILEAPAWDTVLPHLRDVLTTIDLKIVQSIAEGLLKESIHTCHHRMLDLALSLRADPTQRIRYYDWERNRHVLFTPLVALYSQHRYREWLEIWKPVAGSLILSLLEEDTQVQNSTLLWIIRVSCHAIAENVIRSQPDREIDFSIAVSSLEGGSDCFGTYLRVTPLLVACSDARPSAERFSLVHCLLERNAKANLETMIAAAGTCDEEIISLLHQHGSPVSGFIHNLGSPLSSACTRFLRSSTRYHAKSTAILLLLRLGASPNGPENKELNSWGLSPLHLLSVVKELPAVEEALDSLIEHGANINQRARFYGFKDLENLTACTPYGHLAETALEYAIVNSRWNTATRLLSADCQLTGREIIFIGSTEHPGTRPEYAMGPEGFRRFVSSLLGKAPSQAAAIHWSGVTVLQLAIQNENTDMILALLAFGVAPMPLDFLHMLLNRTVGRAKICPQPSSIQMKLLLASGFSEPPITTISTIRLILAFACPKVVRHILNGRSDAYDSEGLCYLIARIASQDQISYHFDWYVHDKRRDQQAESLTIEDLAAFMSRRTLENSTKDWERTAVTMAARAGRVDILRILLQSNREEYQSSGLIPMFLLKEALTFNPGIFIPSGTDVNEWNWGRLGIWIAYCRMDDPNTKCSPLTAAAMVVPDNVSEEVVELLLEFKYQPDGWTVLVAACQGLLSVLQRLKSLECWPDILRHEERPDWCPTALQAAVCSGNIGIVRFLLDTRTTVDMIDSSPCRPFCFGPPAEVQMDRSGIVLPRTALQHAVAKKDTELVTLLVSTGANVNAPAAMDSGATALQIACIQGSMPMVQYLISMGADQYATGAVKYGRTALQGAAESGRKDVVELLLARGAMTVRDRREDLVKAIFLAERNAQHVVASILRHGLNPQWSSKDDETLAMFQDDLKSSSEHSALTELRLELRAWTKIPLEDRPDSLRAYESTPDSDVETQEPDVGNPPAVEADNFCFPHDLELGLEGHGELDISGISDMNMYEAGSSSWLTFQEDSGTWAQGSLTALEADNSWLVHDVEPGFAGHGELEVSGIGEMNLIEGGVEWWPTFQQDIAAWVEGQPSLDGPGDDDMLLDDLFSTGHNLS